MQIAEYPDNVLLFVCIVLSDCKVHRNLYEQGEKVKEFGTLSHNHLQEHPHVVDILTTRN